MVSKDFVGSCTFLQTSSQSCESRQNIIVKLFSDNDLTIEKCNTTKIKKNLAEWLDFTKTPTSIRRDITDRFIDDLEGKSKTGFQPYKSSEGICFDHKWTMIIGRKI